MRLLFTFLLSLLVLSCTVQDDRIGRKGDPNCPFCNGKGYTKHTDLLFFNTYYECECVIQSYDDFEEEDIVPYEISFRGGSIIVEPEYGACNNRCGCDQYAHYPGRTACVFCAENNCMTNKFGHRR